jgi:transketolase
MSEATLTVSTSTKSVCWIDAIQKGKPSWYPMGMAPVAYGQKRLNFDPTSPPWPNGDRAATHRCCSMRYSI